MLILLYDEDSVILADSLAQHVRVVGTLALESCSCCVHIYYLATWSWT